MAAASSNQHDPFLRGRYDEIWSHSVERIRAGAVKIDPTLARMEEDRRRGMTLLFRPAIETQQRISRFLDELREMEPDQRYYHPSELHLTFLSPFTATKEHELFFARTDDYVAAVDSAVPQFLPFPIALVGVTASPEAILIQGFTDAAALNAARDLLRQELRARGLVEGLDSRYRLETAHMTVARFRQSLRDGPAFSAALERRRDFDFGPIDGDRLELVKNDWYMSRGRTELVREYKLTK